MDQPRSKFETMEIVAIVVVSVLLALALFTLTQTLEPTSSSPGWEPKELRQMLV